MAKTNIVHKPNELVYILPSSGQRVSPHMRLMYNWIILISQQFGDKAEYVIVLNDLLELCKIKPDMRTVKKIFKDIRRLDFEWRHITEDTEDTRIIGLLDEPRFISKRGTETIVTWKLNPIIKQRLLDPKTQFTRLNMEMMTLLKTGAAMALYELCARYLTNNKAGGPGRTGKHPVSWWMPALVGSHEYKPEYKYFKRDFLKTAIEEINKETDLNVELVEYNLGKTVESLEFLITRKPEAAAEYAQKEMSRAASRALALLGQGDYKNIDNPFFKRMCQLGVTPDIADKMVERYQDEEYLRRHIDALGMRMEKGEIKYPGKWLESAANNNYDYSDVKKPPQYTQPSYVSAAARLPFQSFDKQAQELLAFKDVDVRLKKDAAIDDFRHLSLSEQDALIEQFLASSSSYMREQYRNKKLNSGLVLRALETWLVNLRKNDEADASGDLFAN